MRNRFLTLTLLAFAFGCKKKPPEEIVDTTTVSNSVAAEPEKIPDEVVNLARNFARVYFDFDSSTLSADGKAALDENVRIMQARPDLKLEVQGHADERGTTDYNLSLGEQRAQSVYRYMQSSGIGQTRLKVVSYGEERPLASGNSESAWSKNRRCEFIITWSNNNDGVQGSSNP
jgi:peptidoglycan-associated lipoprotein